jgi:O-acetyl-ADP-ribose deacetylase (regulator of RNase III)
MAAPISAPAAATRQANPCAACILRGAMLPSTVRHYQVWGRLSAGGMGDVWLARHAELALPVVIKTLHQHDQATAQAGWPKLLAEARMSARLTSPRVVRVIDVGRLAEGDPAEQAYLVEEYVDGIDLAELDHERRRVLGRGLPLWFVCDVLAQAAEGLHAAHQSGVVHRDVKPSNLFGYGHGQVKVGDFGIAAAAGAEDAPRAGTALFMAPEQFEGGKVGRRADVYALGATGFALRHGRVPWPSLAEVLARHRADPFPPAPTPEEAFFQHVIARMLTREYDRRDPHVLVARHQLHGIARATAPRTPPVTAGDGAFVLSGVRVTFELGDLADQRTDALVNSASTALEMRSGIGDALRRRGGDEVEAEAVAQGERALGECVHTGGGALPVRGVIHAVGAWNEVSCIARATHRALFASEERAYRSLAFPALGTGRGRVSVEASVDAMVGALRMHLLLGGSRLEHVRFVFLDEATRRRALEVASSVILGVEEAFTYTEVDDRAALAAELGQARTQYVAPADRPRTVPLPDVTRDPR